MIYLSIFNISIFNIFIIIYSLLYAALVLDVVSSVCDDNEQSRFLGYGHVVFPYIDAAVALSVGKR